MVAAAGASPAPLRQAGRAPRTLASQSPAAGSLRWPGDTYRAQHEQGMSRGPSTLEIIGQACAQRNRSSTPRLFLLSFGLVSETADPR